MQEVRNKEEVYTRQTAGFHGIEHISAGTGELAAFFESFAGEPVIFTVSFCNAAATGGKG